MKQEKEKEKEIDEEMLDNLSPLEAVVKSVPEEVCSDILKPIETGLDSEMEDDEEFWPFSRKPFFHLILAKSHVTSSFLLGMPAKLIKILPSQAVPVVLRYGGKKWNMVYLGANKAKRFDRIGWKAFVLDNNLKVGYGCFFELSECSQSRIKFRVQVIRTEGIPCPEEDQVIRTEGIPCPEEDHDIGCSPDKPIMIC